MNWEDERYVRLYVRDTGDWCALSWDGQALLMQLLRKADRAGIVQLGKRGRAALPAMLGHHAVAERIDTALSELLQDGCVEMRDGYLVIPNFLRAQESKQSDRLRQQESRARRLADARIVSAATDASQPVTVSHEASPAVTSGHSVPSRTVPNLAVPKSEPNGSVAMTSARSPLPNPQPALLPDALPPQVARKTREPKPKADTTSSASALVWSAYAAAFTARYGTEPTRNARVNAQIAQFVGRVPAEEAPQIAAFYLRHSAAFYAGQMHSVGLLLRDAEKLRAEWQRGRTVNMTEARRNEQTAANPWVRRLAEMDREKPPESVECRVDDDDDKGKE